MKGKTINKNVSGLKTRLISCLFLKNGLIVRSEDFKHHQIIGDPLTQLERYNQWMVDELIYIDISRNESYDVRRDDAKIATMGKTEIIDIISEISKKCFVPLTFGGRIRSLEDIRRRLYHGADKVTINTMAVEHPDFINESSSLFGSQCILLSMDVKRHPDGRLSVFSHNGTCDTGLDPARWAREAERRGAGEIFLNSINQDGKGCGYDLELIRAVSEAVSIPVIACGGVGRFQDLVDGVCLGRASAVAAANIFHFTELSYKNAKEYLFKSGVNVRFPYLNQSSFLPRGVLEKASSHEPAEKKIETSVCDQPSATRSKFQENSSGPLRMRYCARCVYPEIAVFVTVDEEGLCSGCRVNGVKDSINWPERDLMFRKILDEYRSKDGSNYDCIIPVSGGKDSYFQTYMMKVVYKMNPLLVTYNGNNYMPEGLRNLENMRTIFGCDHIFFTPSVPALIKMNRAGFLLQGDMNWHAHCGIYTYPIQIAVQHKIPLIIWGEHGPTHIGGQHSLNDFVEFNARARLEHNLRGYDWYDFVGKEGLMECDLLWAKYPSDKELDAAGIRQLHLGNYVKWDEMLHGPKMIAEYGFKLSDLPFERTYRRMSNLDDMHENGIHDYMKFIKFGYGRATDHASKDIRAGHMMREEGVTMVRKYDHVKPMRDLTRWLDYVGWTEVRFDEVADTFRDPRVWWIQGGQWWKNNLWGGSSPYGKVTLNPDQQKKFRQE